MASFPELRAFRVETGADTIELPVGGRVYSWTRTKLSISAGLDLVVMREELVRFTRRLADGDDVDMATELNTPLLDPARERTFMLDLIGDQRVQMEADGVSWGELTHVGQTLLTWHLTGPDAAMIVWLQGRTPDEVAAGDDAGPPPHPG